MYREFGDPCGYEEIYYRTPKGSCFVYGIGGFDSLYPSPLIKPLTHEEIEEIMYENQIYETRNPA